MSSSCKNSPDKFCFICGEITLCSEKRNVTPKLRDAYFKYFGITLKQDEWWQPKYVCGVCYVNMHQCVNFANKKMPFRRPMIWSEPYHPDNCYFCATNATGAGYRRGVKRRGKVQYPDVESVKKSVPYDDINYSSPQPLSQVLNALPPPSTNDDSMTLSSNGELFVRIK